MSEAFNALKRIVADNITADDVESETLDFKRQSDSRRDTEHDIADAAVCFANARGGSVVVGVADRVRGVEAVLGTDLDPSVLRRRIYELTTPPLDVVVRSFTFEGKALLEVDVQEGLDVYASRKKAPTRRFETQCLEMSPSQISRLHDERRGADWSAVATGRPVSHCDPDAVVLLRTLMRRLPNRTLQDMSDDNLPDVLRTLGLATADGMLNHAGELLLCRDPGGLARELIVYQHRASMGGEADYGRRLQGPLLVAFIEGMNVIEARIGTTPINLPSGQQLQIQDYPVAAIREAISNAVMHGDHRDRRPVYIEHSPESFEVRSPGPLVAGVSPANILTHPPKPRFPALADALRSLGLAEKWGQGVDRMYREMIRSGKEIPTVSVTPGEEPETSVRFMGGPPNARITKFISTLPENEQDDTDTLLVVSVLTGRRTISAETIAPILQREPDAAQAVLRRLASDDVGILEVTPRTARLSRPEYRLSSAAVAGLGPALGYTARPQADRERKIVEHVREYDSINNGAIQRLFDVDVYAARDILQELVGREILVRVSEQSRGTAVRYGPGPKFPSRRRSR